MLAPASQRYVKSQIMAKNNSMNSNQPKELQINREGILEEIFQVIFPILDKKLEEAPYLCGEQMTAADIYIYMEVQQILFMTSNKKLNQTKNI